MISQHWRTLGSWLPAALTAGLMAACGGGGGSDGASSQPGTATIAAATMRVHFHRTQNDTADWGVYSWSGPLNPKTAWPADRIKFASSDGFGAYVDIPLNVSAGKMDFLVIDGNGNKNCGSDQHASFKSDIATKGQEVWMLEGDCTVYDQQPAITVGSLSQAKAMWLDGTTIAWPSAPASGASYQLYYAANGGISAKAEGVTGADGAVALQIAGGLSDALKSQYPYLASATALTLADGSAATLKPRLKGQLVVAQLDASGKVIQATSLQTAGVLDALYASSAKARTLGVSFSAGNVPTFALWAPTAKSVKLNVFPESGAAVSVDMVEDSSSGVWSYTATDASWTNAAYYTYTVNVFSRGANNTVVSNTVTDPYSLSLGANSQKSFVANLADASLKPAAWDGHAVPTLDAPEDIAIYELHVRDFSINDATVPAAHQGKYLAFTDSASNGMKHLKLLQQAGLTHVQLMPVYDIASVNEAGCSSPSVPNAAADSDQQQAAVSATKDADCFNWGYDPYHYTAPEGSYATDASNGRVRVKEFRQMVKALHDAGLRVTMDVVYNHTFAAGQDDKSVLDKVVPGYYYRLDNQGAIFNSTCCANTAAENAMMAKLMIDSVKTWATQYQVDGFRFDIMGHLPLDAMLQLRSDTDAAAGRSLYYYGEGWNFGEVANDARFKHAAQDNMAGTGYGTFNDRLRDAIRGGGCCDTGANLFRGQGFANGAYLDPNGQSTQTKDDLLHLTDLVKLGMAGTLRDYELTDKDGASKKGSELAYFDLKAGYTLDPQEAINYIEAHDNQTLFDINAYKLPQSISKADRVRVQNLGTAILTLSQGIPFYHAGQELLRSKSLDRDSYNSGDWFNRLFWDYSGNSFGVGLPVADKNGDTWDLMRPLLTNPLLQMGSGEIVASRDVFRDFLAIRKSSTLFRLRSGSDVINRVAFHNNGPSQVPGVVVESIDGSGYAGAVWSSVVVVANADKAAHALSVDALKAKTYSLHPVLAAGSDAVVKGASLNNGSISIPARSVAVFVAN